MDLFVFKTIENKNKTIILKEFRKPWDKDDYNLPWEKGYYNEPNTLLLDDFPYKALLFSINNLRAYLDGLSKAKDMRKYIKENSFGKLEISETSKDWNYYRWVIDNLSMGSVNVYIHDFDDAKEEPNKAASNDKHLLQE
ncbi:hypothetical protein GmHk_19G054979 [Glycine max]|nr:hypothetical protein GmHk_19G054979 [Glycine max]